MTTKTTTWVLGAVAVALAVVLAVVLLQRPAATGTAPPATTTTPQARTHANPQC